MNQKRPGSRHLGRLLGLSVLLAGMLLAGCLYLLATPTATGRMPTPLRAIPPESFVRIGNAIRTPGAPQSTPTPTLAVLGPTRAPVVVPTPKLVTKVEKPSSSINHAPTIADAKAYALDRLGTAQYACLADIVKHEDGTWDPYRTNSSSGAYGIPQALPGSKMKSAGSDWRWNRITQVRWMIGYVNGRYGSACQAAAFRTAHGWY